MRYTDLNELSDEQLVHTELTLERELVTAKFRAATNQLDDTSTLMKLRRDIARCQTQARQRERSQDLRTNALRDRYASSFSAEAGATTEVASSGGFLKGIVDKIGGNE